MNLLLCLLLPLDENQLWPVIAICGLLIMAVVIASQLLFNAEARMRRKAEQAKRRIDPGYWGSYEKR